MPVYNGQRYVAQAIESILAQTFADLQLIISDNASTDDTSEICRAFAAKDKRVCYRRLDQNIGAIANYERTFRLCGEQYFKWAAHDDLLEPAFIQRCVETLDADDSVVLTYPRACFIDEHGRYIKDYHVKLATDSEKTSVRFDAIARADHKL